MSSPYPEWTSEQQAQIQDVAEKVVKRFKHFLDEGYGPSECAKAAFEAAKGAISPLQKEMVVNWLCISLANRIIEQTKQAILLSGLSEAMGGEPMKGLPKTLGADEDCDCDDCKRDREEKEKGEEGE